MKKLVAALATFALATLAVAEEADASGRLHAAAFVGAYVPTGELRSDLDRGVLSGVTASWDVHPHLAVVGSFGWVRTSHFAVDIDLLQYDVGVQAQYAYAVGEGFTVRPFVGAGVGARTYRPRFLRSETDLAGYVALGATAQYRMLEVSVTARDNLTPFDGIGGDLPGETRNDLGLFASLGMRF